ncbi:hypothetical protein QE152_g41463, partial [Popillia japonica]
VEQWGKAKGMEFMQGPLGFTDFDAEGMLIEGFDELSTMATIYNYPYYPMHLEKLGLHKEADWVEYQIFIPESIPEKHRRVFEFCEAEYFLAFREEKVVGRVAAIINRRANETWSKKEVRFGWLDFIDDTEASKALLDAEGVESTSRRGRAVGQSQRIEFCEAEYFLAFREEKVVGRVAAIINRRANETWSKKEVRFGWLDFIDDTEASKALLDAGYRGVESTSRRGRAVGQSQR